MGQRELETALRRQGETDARAIWQQVEAEASSLRAETEQQLEQDRQSLQNRVRADVADLFEGARSAAQHQAQLNRLAAELQLAQRLKVLAEGLLEDLNRVGGDALFDRLAAEIPDHPWRLVKVHPRDQQAARERFPRAEVVTSEQISGGLVVQDRQGRVVVINTLQKRLTHLWADLLPQLLAELRPGVKSDEAAS